MHGIGATAWTPWASRRGSLRSYMTLCYRTGESSPDYIYEQCPNVLWLLSSGISLDDRMVSRRFWFRSSQIIAPSLSAHPRWGQKPMTRLHPSLRPGQRRPRYRLLVLNGQEDSYRWSYESQQNFSIISSLASVPRAKIKIKLRARVLSTLSWSDRRNKSSLLCLSMIVYERLTKRH